MKFEYVPDLPGMKVTHPSGKGEVVFILAKALQRDKLASRPIAGGYEGVFDIINLFLEDHKPVHGRIYEVYQSLRETVDSSREEDIPEVTATHMKKLLKIPGCDPGSLQKWVNETVKVPASVMKVFNDNDGKYSREKTYLYTDYLELATIVIYTKLMLPMLATALRSLYSKYGTLFRRVVIERVYPSEIKELPGYRRLLEFVDVSIGKSLSTDKIMDSKVSSEDAPRMMMAELLLVRMVSCCVVRSSETEHMVTHLTLSMDKFSGGSYSRYKPRSATAGGTDEETSIFDTYRVDSELTEGEKILSEFSATTRHLEPLLKGVVDITEVRRYRDILRNNKVIPTVAHVAVCKAVLFSIISPGAFRHINDKGLTNLMAVCYILLRTHHPTLALIMMSGMPGGRRTIDDPDNIAQVLPNHTKEKLHKAVPVSVIKSNKTTYLIDAEIVHHAGMLSTRWILALTEAQADEDNLLDFVQSHAGVDTLTVIVGSTISLDLAALYINIRNIVPRRKKFTPPMVNPEKSPEKL